jgi:hypothetical protein
VQGMESVHTALSLTRRGTCAHVARTAWGMECGTGCVGAAQVAIGLSYLHTRATLSTGNQLPGSCHHPPCVGAGPHGRRAASRDRLLHAATSRR